MVLRLGKVKISANKLIYFILILTLLMGTLTDDFGLPGAIRYINDIIVFILFILLLAKKDFINKIKHYKMNSIFIAMIIFSVINIFTIIINLVPLTLVLWAIRNTYRFFIFFWACIMFLKKEDLEKLFEIFYWLQWLNLVLVIYQFICLGLKQDYLGGIFGHGGNAGLLIYSVILVSYVMTKYISKEYSTFRMLFVLISTSLISVLAEIRVFFVMIGIIVIVNFFFNKNIFRKSLIFLGMIVMFVIAVEIYKELFPYVNLSIKALYQEGNYTGGGYNISRLNAFRDINNIFFKDNMRYNLIGFGFGNCEFSNIPIFCSEFYRKYGSFNYRWFTNQWIFLETGFIGVLTYLNVFFTALIYSLKSIKRTIVTNRSWIIICVIMILISLISFFYNSLLKADYGYIAFFSIAISSVICKPKQI